MKKIEIIIKNKKYNDWWYDGKCNKCGSEIIEMPADNKNIPIGEEKGDYMNICSNPKCKEHKFHYVGDMEELDYYEHK